jgi:regulator of sirC expression with transglutaminase-like and TPR domain
MSVSFHFPELWSTADDCAAQRLEAAAQVGDLASGLFAIEGACAEVIAQGQEQIEAWGAQVWERCGAVRPRDGSGEPDTLGAQYAALKAVLGEDAGLCGDCEDYYHPRNSALSAVLTRRRGLPILLSCVWIEVGRRAGVHVEGVGLPGHFLVRVGTIQNGQGGVIADPFDRGALREEEACAQIVRCASKGKLPWRPSFLDAVNPSSIFERVLRNLICAHERRQDAPALYRYTRLMASLCPQDIDVHMLHAHVAEAVGDLCAARRVYAAVCDRFPQTEGAQVSAQRLDLIDKRRRCIN